VVTNQFGQMFLEADDLVTMLYRDPNLDVNKFEISDPQEYNNAVKQLHLKLPQLQQPRLDTTQWLTQEQFDAAHQADYFIPKEYEEIDVMDYLSQKLVDKPQKAIDRVITEYKAFSDLDMIPMLRYLIYLVDVMRKNNVVWGVGRGSSVASYVLYLIGIHKVDSIKHNLDYREFLR
jgi:DNA polymerase III alpha subunit